MDKNSKLDATATGAEYGPGYTEMASGGSYGGQGGSSLDDSKLENATYGTFDLTISKDDWINLENFTGSGGSYDGASDGITRGGGAIYLSSRLY
jgi:hypothetical protein